MTIRKGQVITLIIFEIPTPPKAFKPCVKVQNRVVDKAGDKYFYVTSNLGSARRFEQASVGKPVTGMWPHVRTIVAYSEESKKAAITLASKTMIEQAEKSVKDLNALALQYTEALQEGITIEEKQPS